MAKYQTKPEIVDASRFDPGGEHRHSLPMAVRAEVPLGFEDFADPRCVFWLCVMGDQQMQLDPGDWIVLYSSGRRRAFSPEKFAQLYEAAPVEAECPSPGS